MAIDTTARLLGQIHRTIALREGAKQTDGQLLAAFIERRDEAAFAALVHRHGSMVWGVCRRILSNPHDVDDAFQATFLVLVRKAHSIRPREMVANWLYGVACQTAIRVRANNAKRQRREMTMAVLPETEALAPEPWDDLQPLIDQELSRLPDRYRAPIVLCDLEGKTRKEAAKQLGWPEGSVSSRLARARVMLAKRLTKRGVTLSGGSIAVMLSANSASAAPALLLEATIQSGSALAAGRQAMVAAQVVALTEGTVKGMLLMKLKTLSFVVVLGVALASIGGWFALRDARSTSGEVAAREANNSSPETSKEPKPTPASEREKLEGEWEIVTMESEGANVPAKDMKELRIVFRGDEFIARSASGIGKDRVSKYKLDPTKSPKEIDITSLEGPDAGKASACIYSLEADGQLRLCMAYFKDIDKRPKEFKTVAGDGRMLMVLKQMEKPKKKPIAQPDDKERAAREAIQHYLAALRIGMQTFDAKDAASREKLIADLEATLKALKAIGQDKEPKPIVDPKKPNQNREQAAKWLQDNGDKLVLYFEGGGSRAVAFSTDKRFIEARGQGNVFLMSKDEAASIVQVLLETGLWGRVDGLQPCIPFPARRISLHAQGGGGDGGGSWTLGGVNDDISDLLIVKHLLKTFDGPRREALNQILSEGVGKKKN